MSFITKNEIPDLDVEHGLLAHTLAWLVWIIPIGVVWYVWGTSTLASGAAFAYLFLLEPWHWGILGALIWLLVIFFYPDD